jgi:hypothetical protein
LRTSLRALVITPDEGICQIRNIRGPVGLS